MSQETRIISSIRAARAVLGWSQPDLAEQSGVSVVAIARLESGMAVPRITTLSKLKEAFLKAGIHILDDQPMGGYTLTASASAIAESERQTHKKKEEKGKE